MKILISLLQSEIVISLFGLIGTIVVAVVSIAGFYPEIRQVIQIPTSTENANLATSTATLTQTVTSTPQYTTTPKTDSTSTPVAKDALKLPPVKFTITLTETTTDETFLRRFEDIFLSKYNDRQAGLVITTGYHSQIAKGVETAKRANQLLSFNYPTIFSGADMKAYWHYPTSIETGTVEFEIYLFLSE